MNYFIDKGDDVIISIIIVNYNTFQLTKDCIESIFENTSDICYEIILVDNNSSDGSVEKLSTAFPGLEIYSNTENLGFGKANNIGVAKSKGKYIFLLNSDTLLHNNAVKIFLDFFIKNNYLKIGIIGSLLLNADGTIGKSSSDLPTISSIIIGTLKGIFYRAILRRNSGFQQIVAFDGTDRMSVGQVVGADMFMLKSTFEEIKGFDPRFFMYFEETDLQRRLIERGYTNFLIKGPRITHLEGRSNISMKKYKFYYKSMWLYFKKHLIDNDSN
jgi:GT2 family glycosyltransferase